MGVAAGDGQLCELRAGRAFFEMEDGERSAWVMWMRDRYLFFMRWFSTGAGRMLKRRWWYATGMGALLLARAGDFNDGGA